MFSKLLITRELCYPAKFSFDRRTLSCLRDACSWPLRLVLTRVHAFLHESIYIFLIVQPLSSLTFPR